MTDDTIRLKAACGYRINEKKQTVDVATAAKMLCGRQVRKYTSVAVCGDEVTLLRHVVKCPFCGGEAPAYPWYFYEDAKDGGTVRLSQSRVYPQLSIYQNQSKSETFVLRQPEMYSGKYICKKCGAESMPSDDTADITIKSDGGKICVKRIICDFAALMKISWLKTVSFSGEFPLYECVCFDFNSGRTKLMLADEHDSVIFCRDITESFDKINGGVLFELLNKHRVIIRTVRRLIFEKSGSMPFSTRQSGLCKFILQTRFIGFEPSFYDAIPFTLDSYKIDSSFAAAAQMLRKTDTAQKLMNDSHLPKTKSIKRTLATSPGLLFYIKECESLCRILDDINLFVRILKCDAVYMILSSLHSYPGMLIFYRDYVSVKSAVSLCDNLVNNCENVNRFAMKYCAASSYIRANSLKKCTKEKNIFNFDRELFNDYVYVPYSMPMKLPPKNVFDCTTGDYTFRPLKTMSDYTRAGKQLDNCLGTWNCMLNAVIVVYKGDSAVAAVEIDGEEITEALLMHNRRIKRATPIHIAIEKWRKKFGLKMTARLGGEYAD